MFESIDVDQNLLKMAKEFKAKVIVSEFLYCNLFAEFVNVDSINMINCISMLLIKIINK